MKPDRSLVLAIAFGLALSRFTAVHAEPAPPVVLTAPVNAELQAPTRSLQGTVVAAREAQLASRIEGRVAWIAPLGSEVKRGDVIARLDDAEARLLLTREQARLRRLEAERDLAQRQAARMSALADVIPAAQRDEAQARAEVLGAQLAEAHVAVELARLALAETTIEAPFAGTVAAELKQPGEQVALGAPVLTLTDTAAVELELAVPVEIAAQAKVGHALAVDGNAGGYTAQVRAIVPAAAQTRQLRARLALPPELAPAVGSALTVAWPVAVPAPALTVPMDALVRRTDGVHVMRIEDGVARRLPVTLGARSGNRVGVIGALAAGDEVVIRGGERLADGARVTVGSAEVLAGTLPGVAGPAGAGS